MSPTITACGLCGYTHRHHPDCPNDEPDLIVELAAASEACARVIHALEGETDERLTRAVMLAEQALDALDEAGDLWLAVYPPVEPDPNEPF
jgi:uncharacterized protein (DUF849 family)